MQFQIDPGGRQPIYRQLMTQVREAVARGKLAAGDRIPSVRQVSRELVVNPNTVARAYTELEREGVLHTRPGLGVFVAELKAELTKRVRKQKLVELLDQFLTESVHLGFGQDEVLQLATERAQKFQWTTDVAHERTA